MQYRFFSNSSLLKLFPPRVKLKGLNGLSHETEMESKLDGWIYMNEKTPENYLKSLPYFFKNFLHFKFFRNVVLFMVCGTPLTNVLQGDPITSDQGQDVIGITPSFSETTVHIERLLENCRK